MRALHPLLGLMGLATLPSCHADRSSPSDTAVPAHSAVPTATPSIASSLAKAPEVPSAGASLDVAAKASVPVDAGAPVVAASKARREGCRSGMVRVEGEYCPAVVEVCLELHPEYQNRGDRTVSERCLRYERPSRCVSKTRQRLDFCMDEYEYPNVQGELPQVLTSWRQAVATCEAQGKRLCTEDEFNFACEGPEILPYVWGYDRAETTCNIDREYRFPDHSKSMLHYDKCLTDPWCSKEMARLDQRERIGQRTTCVSWAGVHDLNGNVNEWVYLPKEKPPNRSGLKGGWWGPVRNRCRPTVTFHKEEDYGYEQGFRCCADPMR